jgi:CxxC motif-containing protein (DUF1111 family)
MEIFLTTQDRPIVKPQTKQTQNGYWRFNQLGCAYCHRPEMKTQSRKLHYSYPEIETEPYANIFYAVDLTGPPAFFETTPQGGLLLRIGSDFKRHDMGSDLVEDFHLADEKQNREFITARLWGVADTAPYLHDGRALTLNEAIAMHGGEAESARDAYLALSPNAKNQLLSFLGTLRNPREPNKDVLWD